jgi:hypothetical protein
MLGAQRVIPWASDRQHALCNYPPTVHNCPDFPLLNFQRVRAVVPAAGMFQIGRQY